MAKYEISAIFNGIDKTSLPLKNIQKSIQKTHKNIRNIRSGTSKLGKVFSSTFFSMTSSILSANVAMGAFKSMVVGTIQKGVDMQDTLLRANLIHNTYGKLTDETYKKMQKTVAHFGATTVYSSSQISKSFKSLMMSGFDVRNAIGLLPSVIDFATVAELDLGEATSKAADLLGALGKITKDAVKNSQNLRMATDQIAVGAQHANVSVQDLFASTVTAGGAARLFGQKFANFAPLLMAGANAGIKAEEAGTALKTTFLKLVEVFQSKPKMRILNSLDVKLVNAQGKFRNIIDIVGDLQKSLKGLTQKKRAIILNTIFGRRGLPLMTAVLGTSKEKLLEYQKLLQNAGGTAHKIAKTLQGDLKGQQALLSSAYEGVQESIFRKIGGGYKDSLAGLTNFLLKIKDVIDNSKRLIPIIKGITMEATIMGGAFALMKITRGFQTLRLSILRANGVMKFFNTTMRANPLGLIFTALTAVFTLLSIFFPGALDSITKGFWFAFTHPIKAIINILGLIVKLVKYMGDFSVSMWDMFTNFAPVKSFIKYYKNTVLGIVKFIKMIVKFEEQLYKKLFNIILHPLNAIKKAFSWISSLFDGKSKTINIVKTQVTQKNEGVASLQNVLQKNNTSKSNAEKSQQIAPSRFMGNLGIQIESKEGHKVTTDYTQEGPLEVGISFPGTAQ